MQIGTLSIAAVACALLTGCVAMTTTYTFPLYPLVTKPHIPCKDGCDVNVKVVEKGDGTCEIEDIGPIDMVDGSNVQKSIKFKIDGYKFSDESYKFGFFVKVDPEDKFKSAKVTGGGKTLEVVFDKKSAGRRDFTYGLVVRRDNGTWCKPLDPWMIS